MVKTHWVSRFVRFFGITVVLFTCLMMFVFSPYYPKTVTKLLNYFVSVEVNQVAAKSQQQAALTEDEILEPGSKLWIARQAYLKLLADYQQSPEENKEPIALLHQRYSILKQRFLYLNKQSEFHKEQNTSAITLSSQTSVSHVQPINDQELSEENEMIAVNDSTNEELMQTYITFLTTYLISPDDEKILNQMAENENIFEITPPNHQEKFDITRPYAIVVLGGGLTLDENKHDIVINRYTRLRLEKALEIHYQTQLPIVLSGVESPYMQKWLQTHGVDAKLLENRSMNTCENSRFSSLLLQKKGGAPTVILITDAYHMPRTRRLFALNGIETIAVEARMPTELTDWKPSKKNYDHIRRANYELLATARDVLFGSSGCREVP